MHSIPTTSKVVVTFPTVYTMPTSCSITGLSTNVKVSGTACSIVSGNFEITNFLLNAFDSLNPVMIQFTLNSITLPMTTASRTGLKVAI